jgi:hypothetical protein
MGQETLVGDQIQDGQRLVDRLTQDGFEVAAAFWLKADADSQWYLYIVSPIVDAEGLHRAYRRIHPIIWQMQEQPSGVDPFDVKLIGPRDPLAAAVLAIQHGYPRRSALRYGGGRLVDVTIDGAYLYPLPQPSPG